MLVGSKEALGRLHSSDNLMNRLSARRGAMGLFGIGDKASTPITSTSQSVTVPTPEPFVNPFQKQPEPTAALVPSPAKPIATPVAAVTDSKNPSLDNLVGNADTQIKLATAHDKALDTLVSAVNTLATKLDDIKPEKLAGVITATSKVVDQIQRQRIESGKNNGNQSVHLHFYTPVQRKQSEYDIIDVG